VAANCGLLGAPGAGMPAGRSKYPLVSSRDRCGADPSTTFHVNFEPSGISVRELERESSRRAGQRPEDRRIALAVIGAGRAGGSIAAAAGGAGIPVRTAGREDALDACRRSEAALLCVPDAAIADAAAGIAGAVPPL